MNRTDYIIENRKWLDENAIIVLEAINDQQFAALAEATESVFFTPEPGMACGLAQTFEGLENYENARIKHWRECGKASKREFAGFPAMHYENVQMMKGQPRISDLIIVDVGDFQVTLC